MNNEIWERTGNTEWTYLRSIPSYNSLVPEKPEKIPLYAYKWWEKKPRLDEKTRKGKQHPMAQCSEKEIKFYSYATNEMGNKQPNIKLTNKHSNQQI